MANGGDGIGWPSESFRAKVEKADPDFYRESNNPIVYFWPPPAKPRRDPGANGGPYA